MKEDSVSSSKNSPVTRNYHNGKQKWVEQTLHLDGACMQASTSLVKTVSSLAVMLQI